MVMKNSEVGHGKIMKFCSQFFVGTLGYCSLKRSWTEALIGNSCGDVFKMELCWIQSLENVFLMHRYFLMSSFLSRKQIRYGFRLPFWVATNSFSSICEWLIFWVHYGTAVCSQQLEFYQKVCPMACEYHLIVFELEVCNQCSQSYGKSWKNVWSWKSHGK